MTIIITVQQALDKGIWDKVAELKGINLWAVNEGQISEEAMITLTEGEAIEIGLINKED